MELLKKFQGCRSYVNSTLQKAEQVMAEQTSYMGKDNLQRLIAKVTDSHHRDNAEKRFRITPPKINTNKSPVINPKV